MNNNNTISPIPFTLSEAGSQYFTQFTMKNQKHPPRNILSKKVFWKYEANLQGNTDFEVWFQ